MTVTHRHVGQIRPGRLYPDGYQPDPSSCNAGLTTDSLMAITRHSITVIHGEIRSGEIV
jgi:hypothetical protein